MRKAIILSVLFLTGCSYRYGAGYFSLNDPPPSGAPAAYPTASAEPPYATSSSANSSAGSDDKSQKNEEPCDKEERLTVTNKLDSKNQTIETTAITKRTVVPCQK